MASTGRVYVCRRFWQNRVILLFYRPQIFLDFSLYISILLVFFFLWWHNKQFLR